MSVTSKAAIICALVGASLGAARGASASVLWGLERDGDIYTLNTTTTGAATYVATAPGVAPANEIEINPLNGKAYILYGTTANQNLREIDLATGTLLGTAVPLGAEFGGLEFVAGTLYGSGNGGATGLHTIDVTTGAATKIGTGTFNAGGLAYDAGTATMYGISAAASDFFSVNLLTGAATVIDANTVGRGLAFGPDGRLYHAGSGSTADTLKTINPITGASADVGLTGTPRLLGLAAVVPEPSLSLIAAALAVALPLTRRRPR